MNVLRCHGRTSPLAPPRRPRGFTLIELLVVIAVIGLLVALLIPVIMRAMKEAASAQCKSNLKQIAGAMMLYVKDYSGFLAPPGELKAPDPTKKDKYLKWYLTLETYMKDPALFTCPAKQSAERGYALNHQWYPEYDNNGKLKDPGDHKNTPREMTNVQNTSATILSCDTGKIENINTWPDHWRESKDSADGGLVRFPHKNADKNNPKDTGYDKYKNEPWRPVPRHLPKRTNCLFFDGHAKSIETIDIVDDNFGDPDCLYDNE